MLVSKSDRITLAAIAVLEEAAKQQASTIQASGGVKGESTVRMLAQWPDLVPPDPQCWEPEISQVQPEFEIRCVYYGCYNPDCNTCTPEGGDTCDPDGCLDGGGVQMWVCGPFE